MKLLMIEHAPGVAMALEDQLTAAGHEVVTCFDRVGGPCLGITDPSRCPLATHVDLAILARPEHAEPMLNEAGIVCAVRHHVPHVRVGSAEAELQLGEPGEIEHAADQARRHVERVFAETIEAALADVEAAVTVERHRDGLAITVRVPGQAATERGRVVVADRARAAARAFDPHLRTMDIAVEPASR